VNDIAKIEEEIMDLRRKYYGKEEKVKLG